MLVVSRHSRALSALYKGAAFDYKNFMSLNGSTDSNLTYSIKKPQEFYLEGGGWTNQTNRILLPFLTHEGIWTGKKYFEFKVMAAGAAYFTAATKADNNSWSQYLTASANPSVWRTVAIDFDANIWNLDNGAATISGAHAAGKEPMWYLSVGSGLLHLKLNTGQVEGRNPPAGYDWL